MPGGWDQHHISTYSLTPEAVLERLEYLLEIEQDDFFYVNEDILELFEMPLEFFPLTCWPRGSATETTPADLGRWINRAFALDVSAQQWQDLFANSASPTSSTYSPNSTGPKTVQHLCDFIAALRGIG